MNDTISTKNLTIRILTPQNAVLVTEFYRRNAEDFSLYEPINISNAKTIHYQRQILEYEQHYFRVGSMVRFYIFERNAPFTVIGTVSFREIHRGPYSSCVFGYKMDQNYRRKGYCYEALYHTIALVSKEFSLHRIYADVMPENAASIHLLEKLGFEKEGLQRQTVKIKGQWRDHYLYSKIFPDNN
jgi:ribosomal-protein-alanine N-acetyltransferase